MKICAMCGKKILKSMLSFKIVATAKDSVDCCGRCFMLTRINDLLSQLKEKSDGGPGQSKLQIPH